MTVRHAIIGDVHGCLEELEELCDFLLEDAPDTRIVLTGDLLTKGPAPGGVTGHLAALRSIGVPVESVCGNHDLRLFAALLRFRAGFPVDRLPRAERDAVARLDASDDVDAAVALLGETVERIVATAGDATVVHAGLRPELGLEGTSRHDLVHLKTGDGTPPWWNRYDGRDGLVVFGHKPMRDPVYVHRRGRPIAINVDTGCATGGRLTAYLPETDRFVAVESRQKRRLGRIRGVFEPTRSATLALAS